MSKGTTHAGRGVVRDEVAGALDEDVRPVALLVDDAGLLPSVVEPRRRGAAREALHTAEGCILRAKEDVSVGRHWAQ